MFVTATMLTRTIKRCRRQHRSAAVEAGIRWLRSLLYRQERLFGSLLRTDPTPVTPRASDQARLCSQQTYISTGFTASHQASAPVRSEAEHQSCFLLSHRAQRPLSTEESRDPLAVTSFTIQLQTPGSQFEIIFCRIISSLEHAKQQ